MNIPTLNGTGTSPPYFVGMKVEVGIPLSNDSTFRDWAIINELDEDLVSLQLSRDMLPAGVTLRVGQILTIRSEYDFQIYLCRAYIVSKGFDQELLLRLTGEIVANELREFYRIDAFLPIRFHPLPDQEPESAKKIWDERRRQRRDEERSRELRRQEARRERQRSEDLARERRIQEGASSVGSSRENLREELEESEYYESWNSVTSVAVNISGGGLRISTRQSFQPGELIRLEIFVPSSRSIVDLVARVIFCHQEERPGENRHGFTSGLQFVFIDEPSRTAINRHLSDVQLKRIRQFKGFADVEPLTLDSPPTGKRQYAYLDTVDGGESLDDAEQPPWWKRRRELALALLFIALAWLLYLYFSRYATLHPKSVIQQMFETGIRRFRGGQ